MHSTLPPAWFSDATLQVETAGFLADADGAGVEELWRRWEREGGVSEPGSLDVARYLLAQDVRRCWQIDATQLRPMRDRELVGDWLQKLAAISEGHLEVEMVQEIWARRGLFFRHDLVRVAYRANDATLSAAPTLDDGLLAIADLLEMANAALTYGSFVTIRDRGDVQATGRYLVCWADAKTERRLEELGLVATRLPTTLSVMREGALRDTTSAPVVDISPVQFERLERAALGTEPPPDGSLATLRKQAWRPKIVAGESQGTLDKFGGVPWLPARTRMPKCPHCKGPTFLALQLAARKLPLALDVDGVLQVFLCAGEDPGGCFLEDSGYVVRLETRELKPRTGGTPEGRVHPPLAIVGWDEFVDEPGPCDWPEDVDYDAAEDFFDNGPAIGDKCGGYGAYAQSGQPRCPNPMCNGGQLVFQLESSWDGILDGVYMGDCGKLFIYVCTAHDEPMVTAHIEYH